MPAISPELAARLHGGYRTEICEQLWEQLPEPLRLTCFDPASTARHPAFSWHRNFKSLDLAALPEPMQREIAWCVWRAVEQGGQVHGAYAQLVRRLGRVLDEDRVVGHPAALSLMDRSLEGWDRALAKSAPSPRPAAVGAQADALGAAHVLPAAAPRLRPARVVGARRVGPPPGLAHPAARA